MEKTGLKPSEMDTILNKQSGVYAISEGYSDMRDIYDRVKENEKKTL